MKRPRPRLLMLSPIMPAPAGVGLARRAGMVLDALARDHEVHLLVIPVASGADPTAGRAWAARRCTALAVLPMHGVDVRYDMVMGASGGAARLAYPRPALCRFATVAAVSDAAARLADLRFATLHVFRLYLAPFAEPYLRRRRSERPFCQLDLDDDEVATHERLATLYGRRGDAESAAVERHEAALYAHLAGRMVERFDRVYVASQVDCRRLARRHPGACLAVLPNAVRHVAVRPHVARRAPSLLFVGNLSYAPNQEAVEILCRQVLPTLRRRLGRRAVTACVAGAAPPPALASLVRIAGAQLVADPPRLDRVYREASLVVVPLRTGGGTRIKILEAFAHGRPVVATRIAAEGLAVRDGEHLLLADGPRAIAAACARLLADARLARRLAAKARVFVGAQHGPAAVRAALAAVENT